MKFPLLPWRKQSRNALLGIDINSAAVKLVELNSTAGQYRLEHHAAVPIPALAEKPGENPQVIVDAIQAILQQQKIKTRLAVTSIANTAVMTKVIQLDRSLTETEMAQHIFSAAEHYFNQSIKDICLDFAVMNTGETDSARRDVRVIAAWRREVETRVSILEQAGLQVAAVDMEALALVRAIKLVSDFATIAVIHLNAKAILLSIISHDDLVNVQEENYNCDLSEWSSSDLIDQVVRQWRLFLATTLLQPPQQIFLTGDKASEVLAQLIAAEIPASIQVAKPFLQDPSLLVACGLAMWH